MILCAGYGWSVSGLFVGNLDLREKWFYRNKFVLTKQNWHKCFCKTWYMAYGSWYMCRYETLEEIFSAVTTPHPPYNPSHPTSPCCSSLLDKHYLQPRRVCISDKYPGLLNLWHCWWHSWQSVTWQLEIPNNNVSNVFWGNKWDSSVLWSLCAVCSWQSVTSRLETSLYQVFFLEYRYQARKKSFCLGLEKSLSTVLQ